MIRRPPRSTLFPTRRSSDLYGVPVALPQAPPPDVRRTRRAGGGLDGAAQRRAGGPGRPCIPVLRTAGDRKSTRLNSSHSQISYAVFCLKKKDERIETAALCT